MNEAIEQQFVLRIAGWLLRSTEFVGLAKLDLTIEVDGVKPVASDHVYNDSLCPAFNRRVVR
jgi:hypothetical protein